MIPAGAHHTQPGRSLAQTFGGNPLLRLVGESPETIDIIRVNDNADPSSNSQSHHDSAKSVQVVVMNEE
jgi:hypothetical protein